MSIYKTIHAEMVEGVGAVLADKKKGFNGEFVTPKMIQAHMNKLGYVRARFDTNGWGYDWWMDFKKDGSKSFTAFGTGWDGKFMFYETDKD